MRPILVFDGDCGMCTRSAELAARRFRAAEGDYEIAPYQRLDLPGLGLTPEQCDQALQWVAADGRVSSAQDAVARVLIASRAWARPLGYLVLLPGIHAIAGGVYRWVARNRQRFPGGTPACALPAPPSPSDIPKQT